MTLVEFTLALTLLPFAAPPPDPFAAAERAAQRGRRAEAAELADRALRDPVGSAPPGDPRSAAALARHAGYMRAAGRYEDVRKDLDRLLAMRPAAYDALVQTAAVRLLLEQPAEALALARRAEHADPDRSEAPARAGEALLDLGRYGEAIERLRRAVALEPADYSLRLRLAQAYRLAGREREASGAFAAAAAAAPREAEALVETGYARLSAGEAGAALDLFKDAAKPTNDPALVHHLGVALWNAGKPKEACAEFERALSLRPSPQDEAHTRGWRLRAGCVPPAEAPRERAAVLRLAKEISARCSREWLVNTERSIRLSLERGEIDAAEREARDAGTACATGTPLVLAQVSLDAALAARARGRTVDAARAARRAVELTGAYGGGHLCEIAVKVLHAASGILDSVGDASGAAAVADRLLEQGKCIAYRREEAELHQSLMYQFQKRRDRRRATAHQARAAAALRELGDRAAADAVERALPDEDPPAR